MREIKFRGKRLDNGEWVEGDLVRHYENQRRFIALNQLAFTYTECGIARLVSENFYEVDPSTVGQYTGLNDENGTEIFEGDIVQCWNKEQRQEYWEFGEEITVKDMAYDAYYVGQWECCLVISNVHDKESANV